MKPYLIYFEEGLKTLNFTRRKFEQVLQLCNGTFSVVVDIHSTSNASCPTSAIAQFVKQQRWQMLKLLEGLGKTANIIKRCLLRQFALKRTKATKKVRQSRTIDDEPEHEQNKTLMNSLLAKISLSRRSDNRHFANRICNECL